MNVEAEQGVLGLMLMQPDAIEQALACGGAEIFHDPVHAALFEIARKKHQAGELVSPVTIRDAAGDGADGQVDLSELGGPGYLARLAGAAIPRAGLAGYLDHLADLRLKRLLIAAMSEAQGAIARGEMEAALIAGRLEASLIAASSGPRRTAPVSMQAAVLQATQMVHAAYTGQDTGGVPSGIPDLDRLVPGFWPGDMIVLGGRPSSGKTALALSIALNVARAGHGVGIVSLEMTPEQMALRALSEATSGTGRATSYKSLRKGQMVEDQVDAFRQIVPQVSDLPIHFLSRQHSDLGALIAGCRQIRRALGDKLKLLVVDYAQLIRGAGRSRYEQITDVSIALKALAAQLDVPILVLSQLSRAVEAREDKRPMLSDLRESGQLEQDADAVLFVYRDEYYLERTRPDDADADEAEAWRAAMERARNRMEIIVAKQRQGDIGTARVRCNVALNLIWSDYR